jgi:hypothetical protein
VAAPVERKVQASTAAAAVSGLALWALGHYVFKAGVPDVVASWIYVIVPGVITFGAGYLTRHTPREVPPVLLPAIPALDLPAQGFPPPVPPEKTLIPPAVPE